MQVQVFRDVSFEAILGIQEECLLKVTEDPRESFLLVFEPKPTFTAGISAEKSDLLWDESTCREKEIALTPVTRGGKWTYHGPGQIVVFPILALKTLGLAERDTKAYVAILSKAVQNYLNLQNLVSQIKDEPYGIYVGDEKICSFGIRIQRGVTSHGFALYLSPQHNPFRGIHPCGQKEVALTSLWQNGVKSTWIDASNQLVQSIKKSFILA